jgi:hypothetical protein
MRGPSIYPLTLDLVDASMLPAVELTAAEFTLDAARNLRAPSVQLQPNLSFGFTAMLALNHAFRLSKPIRSRDTIANVLMAALTFCDALSRPRDAAPLDLLERRTERPPCGFRASCRCDVSR